MVTGYNKNSFVLSLLIAVTGTCLLSFPSDDGLRHVGIAFGELTLPHVWGDVYPFSYFEALKDYDPWLGYDLTLRIIAAVIKSLPISPLFSQFMFTKILSLVFVLAFFYLILQRSGILEDIKDQDTFLLAYAVLLLLTAKPCIRMLYVRPFAFGTLFLVYTIGQKGILKGAVSSAMLAFFYPYLAWLYLLPVALAHFLKGNRRFALGAISFTVLFLYLQPSSFWGFQLALFKADLMRDAINPKIKELVSSFHVWFFVYLFVFLIMYPSFSRKAKRLRYENLLIILYLVPSLKYIRYFVDLILPLLFVSFGREMLTILLEPYRKLTSYSRNTLFGTRPRLRPSSAEADEKRRNTNLKSYLIVLYALVFVLVVQLNHKKFFSLQKFQAALSVIPTGSLVLSDYSLQFRTLFLRPDLRIIPSCELGGPTDSISKEYLSFLNKREALPLARKTDARFLLVQAQKGVYADAKDGEFMRLLIKSQDLAIWKFLDSPE